MVAAVGNHHGAIAPYLLNGAMEHKLDPSWQISQQAIGLQIPEQVHIFKSIKERCFMSWAITSDNIEIYYEDTKSNGPAIIFQSGFMGIHDIWKYQVDQLGGEYRCITQDNRGYGLSSSPEDVSRYSTETNVEDLKAVVDDAGINSSFLLVTHSMGSASGLAFAMKYPDFVRGIIMAGGATLGGWPFVRAGAREDIFSSHHTSPSASMRFYRNLGLEEKIAIEARKWNRHVFLNQTKAFLGFTPQPDEAAKVTVPTLVLHGGDDVVPPPRSPSGDR